MANSGIVYLALKTDLIKSPAAINQKKLDRGSLIRYISYEIIMMSYPSLWEVAVLALLREAPMHPYEMQRLLHERHKDELLVLKRGSLYHAVERLLRAGLIEAAATGRTGRRPERTTYRITAVGRQEFARVLQHMVGNPRRESSEFMAALSFLLHLERDEAMAKLAERALRLEEEIRGTEATLKSVMKRVERINLIESEYHLAMRRAELRWVRELLGELRSGRLRWDMQKIFRDARAARKAAASTREKRR
jgi:DNA-binding PadR family transcriptional regulator